LGYLSPPPAPAPVVVYKDVGGLVSEYEAQTELYRRQNREVRLHECRSACTLALSLPNVCVYPDAQVKFHQAYNAITREVDLGVSQKLFDSYPAPVQARLGYLTRQYKVLSGRELIALGMRNCNPGHDDGVLIASRKAPSDAPQVAEAPHDDALQNMAQSVKTAVAKALARPEGAPAEALAFADRSPAPPPPIPGLSQEIEMPLPPRRPDFQVATAAPRPAAPEVAAAAVAPKPEPQPVEAPVVVAAAPERAAAVPSAPEHRGLYVPRLMQGGTPIVATGRFYPPPPERQADRGGKPILSGG
jgi:hypothetical protein